MDNTHNDTQHTRIVGRMAELDVRLRAIGRGRRGLIIFAGIAMVCAGTLAVALLLGFVGNQLNPGPGMRTLLLAVGAVGTAAAFFFFIVLPMFESWTWRSSAVLVETHFGRFRNALVSTVDIFRSGLWRQSPVFAEALIDATWTRCRKLRMARALDIRPAAAAAAVCALSVSMFAATLSLWPNRSSTELSRYLDAPRSFWTLLTARDIQVRFDNQNQVVLRGTPSTVSFSLDMNGRGLDTINLLVRTEGDSEWHTVNLAAKDTHGKTFEFHVPKTERTYECRVRYGAIVSPTAQVRAADRPEISALFMDYRFPAYTELSSSPFRHDRGNIRAIYGTFVRLTVRASTPLRTAAIEMNGEQIPMRLKGATASGSIRVTANDSYRILLTSSDGLDNIPKAFPIICTRDGLPTVKILNLDAGEMIVHMDDVKLIDVDIEARDNEGIQELGMAFKLTQLPDAHFRTQTRTGVAGAVYHDPARRKTSQTLFGVLDDLGVNVEVGDVIEARGYARDACNVDDGIPPSEPHEVLTAELYRFVVVAKPPLLLSAFPGHIPDADMVWGLPPDMDSGPKKKGAREAQLPVRKRKSTFTQWHM